jgi:ATP-dependent exoDNAse (exonuclease V) beta subunit
MEMLAREGLAGWDAARIQALQPAMRGWLARRGHALEAAERGAAEVARAIVTAIGSERGAWVLQSRPDDGVELTLSTAEPQRVATHIVDRTFVDHGERWVIDYKSAWLGEKVGREGFARHAEQYRPQLERYAGLFLAEGLPVRKAVFYLAHGELVEL